jgi:hypothetical protein
MMISWRRRKLGGDPFLKLKLIQLIGWWQDKVPQTNLISLAPVCFESQCNKLGHQHCKIHIQPHHSTKMLVCVQKWQSE